MLRHTGQVRTAPALPNPSVLGLAPAPLPAPARDGPTAADARILRVLDAIARQLDKPQSVKYLAAQLRLSPSRFEHLFKKETGQGFKTFLRAARMTKAENLLQDPTLRIKEVAAAVGYADLSHFSRDFKRQYGQSPSQSRRFPPHRGADQGAVAPDSRFSQQIADFAK
jgi:AraC family transcriptional regulator of arabinose operon